MIDFTYYEVIFGRESEEQVAKMVRKFGGHKILIHYGGQSAKKAGLLDEICGLMKADRMDFLMLGGGVPNPWRWFNCHLGHMGQIIELVQYSRICSVCCECNGRKTIGALKVLEQKDIEQIYTFAENA